MLPPGGRNSFEAQLWQEARDQNSAFNDLKKGIIFPVQNHNLS
jgi:hypothetical protein